MPYFDYAGNFAYNGDNYQYGADCTLRLFRNIENFFQKHIEGFFDKALGSGIQPVELAKNLAKHMENERSVGVAYVYVPNRYTVYLSNDDFNRLQTYKQSIEQELTGYLQQQADHYKYTIMGILEVKLCLDELLKLGKFRIASSFQEQPMPVSDLNSQDGIWNTRVFDKLSVPVVKPSIRLEGMLTVIDGLDTGQKVGTTVTRINIGRRESNEMPLSDMNTSRLHAYVIYEEGGHVLYDAKSLNGTYVNDHRITRKHLKNGDKIKLGSTVILYEVK